MSDIVHFVLGLASPWAYVVVGALALLEGSAFVGLVVPGETAVILGGVLAFQGRVRLDVVILLAAVGAIVGDSIGFFLGRVFGRRWLAGRIGRFIGEERWQATERAFEKWGGTGVLFGRFVGFLRALLPFAAGTARMRYSKFVVFNVLGCVSWAIGFSVLGYFAGGSWRRVEKVAGRASALLAVVLLLAIGMWFGVRWLLHHPDRVRAWGQRQLARPVVGRVLIRFGREAGFLIRRFKPSEVFGLQLTLGLAVVSVLGWAFGALVQDVLALEEFVGVDLPIAHWFVSHRTPGATTIMKVATLLGSGYLLLGVLALAAGYACSRRHWLSSAMLASSYGLAIAVEAAVKVLVHRPRPPVEHLVATWGWSFPSGHTAEAAALFIVIAALINRGAGWRRRVLTWTACVSVIVVVGLSRMYLGVHYLSDVLGGAALGAALAAVALTAGGTYRRAHLLRNSGIDG
ncbi:MAG: bifunctional DedA family/phosphatase PAP2 family protein, partial [Actinomycetota bacterium]